MGRYYENPFYNSAKDYKRDVNLLQHAVNQAALYVEKLTGYPYEECLDSVLEDIGPQGPFPVKDPTLYILRKNEYGDRMKEKIGLMAYIKECVMADRVLSPSLVAYEPASKIKSVTAIYSEIGKTKRSIAKKQMFKADEDGDKILKYIKHCEQTKLKIGVNSISGMYGFSGNVLYRKSGHGTLTTMCRAAAGYGNSQNEKFIGGFRHYHSYDIALFNMLTIIQTTDLRFLERVMADYGIREPSSEETMECILRSTRRYWKIPKYEEMLFEFITRLDGVEKAAICYVGDLYHLMKYNEDVIERMFDTIVTPVDIPGIDMVSLLDNVDDSIKAFVMITATDCMVMGKKLKWLKENHPESYREASYYAGGVVTFLSEYKEFIKAFFVIGALPPAVSAGKWIIRGVVPTGDTDSTIFTTTDWVTWYTKRKGSLIDIDAIWHAVTYMSCQMLVHHLAMFSKNIGVSDEMLFILEMKNEYAFAAYAVTPSRSKHYYALMSAQEGLVFASPKHEKKGVGYKSALVPKSVIAACDEFQLEILYAAANKEQFSIDYIFEKVYAWEVEIERSILAGEPTYLKEAQMKESYVDPTSNIRYHHLWMDVFKDKYGDPGPIPYSTLKVPLDLPNKSAFSAWIDSIEDRKFAKRFEDYMTVKEKKTIEVMQIPYALLGDKGLPEEIVPAINIRRLIKEILESFYLILETLGLRVVHPKGTRLIKDFYRPRDMTKYPFVKSYKTIHDNLLE